MGYSGVLGIYGYPPSLDFFPPLTVAVRKVTNLSPNPNPLRNLFLNLLEKKTLIPSSYPTSWPLEHAVTHSLMTHSYTQTCLSMGRSHYFWVNNGVTSIYSRIIKVHSEEKKRIIFELQYLYNTI